MMPYASVEELNIDLDKVLVRSDAGNFVSDRETLVADIIDKLVLTAISAEGSQQEVAQKAIWELSQRLGIGFTPPDGLISAVARGDLTDFQFPLVDIQMIPYSVVRMFFAASIDMEVGPIVFSCPNAKPNPEWIASVLGAAIKENWQSPVIFSFPFEEIGASSTMIDWKDIFVGRCDALSMETRFELLSELGILNMTQATLSDLEKLFHMPFELLEDFRDEIVEYYADLFEEMELNETFSLVKKFVVPESADYRIYTDV